MKRLFLALVAFVAIASFTARPASAQMVVSDPETEFETYMTAYQTYQQYMTQIQQFQTQMGQWSQQLKDGNIISEGNFSNFTSDLQTLVNSLDTSGSGSANNVGVNNTQLASEYSQTYAGYSPENGDPGEAAFSQMVGNRLAGVLQALQANQVAFTRASNNQNLPQQFASENNADSGTDSLLQTNNAILIELLKDLNYEQAQNAVNMQAILANTAGDTEMSAQSRSEFSSFLQTQSAEYSSPSTAAGF